LDQTINAPPSDGTTDTDGAENPYACFYKTDGTPREYEFIDVSTLASEVHSYMHLSVNFNDSPILDGEVVITPDNKLAYQRHKLDRPHDRRRHNLELLYYIELKIPPSDSTIKK